jgi:hypothetical protein
MIQIISIFTFSGCGGNDNRFGSEMRCLSTCLKHIHKAHLKPIDQSRRCLKPPNLDSCKLCGTNFQVNTKSCSSWCKDDIDPGNYV